MESISIRRRYWLIAALLAIAYVSVCARVDVLLYGDYPDHLARAAVIADLLFHGGQQFGTAFEFHWMPIPYLLGDVLVAGTVELFGVNGATFIWTAVSLLALPLATVFYLRATHAARETRALFFIVALYLSTDWFFLASFLNFRLAIAMVIFVLGLAQMLRHSWSTLLFAGYLAMVGLGYLMHLTFIVFLAAALGMTGLWRLWRRETTFAREVVLFAPVLVALAWHAVSARVYPDAAEVIVGHLEWGSLMWKVRRLDWDFVRLRPMVDWLILLGFAACVVAGGIRIKLRTFATSPAAEMLVLAITFVGIYLALPMRRGDVTYIDVRALALSMPFAFFTLLLLFDSRQSAPGRARHFMLGGFVILAVAQLVYLGALLPRYEQWLTDFRALTEPVAKGANVFPVYTRWIEARWRPFIHASALAVLIDRGGLVPNMFSGDRGQPMKYFRYTNRPYSPANDWYWDPSEPQVDWNAIACLYDFILITEPFEMRRIGVTTTVAARNSSGALLKIDRQQCRRGL